MPSDPRKPLIFGIIALGVLMLGGIIWAAVFLPSEATNTGTYDANVSFNDTNDPTVGPTDAKVTVRIFEDFECPACRTASQGVQYIRKTYGDKVRIVWNDFPLESIHPNARIAANAARCAEEQGKFWEFGDALYSAQDTWASQGDPTGSFVMIAKQLGLNDASFSQCLTDRQDDSKIADDLKEGNANRVDATPTFFIGNTRMSGALTNEDWDRELKKALGIK